MTKKLSEFAGGGLPSGTLPDPLNPNIRALLDSLMVYWPGNHDPEEKAWFRNRGWLAPDNITGTFTHFNYQGGTASFNGSSYLYWDGIDELAFDGSQPFTAICDLYQNVSANDPLFGVGANTSHTGNGWLVMRNLTSDFYLQVNAASGYPTDELQTNAGGGTASKWHTWGVSYDGSKDETGVTFYRDGASQTRNSGANTLTGDASPASSRFYIGSDSSTNNLEGQMGSIYIFDRELTTNEMSWMTNGILRPYVEYLRADTVFTLGNNLSGDITPADVAIGKTGWQDGGTQVVGTAGGGGVYNPSMMDYGGGTGYYSLATTFSTQQTTLVARVQREPFTGGSREVIAQINGSVSQRFQIWIWPSDQSGRELKAQVVAYDSSNNLVWSDITTMDVCDGEVHTIFAAFDAAAGTGLFYVDGIDAIDTSWPSRQAPITGTVETSVTCYIGTDTTNDMNGSLGYIGASSTYLTNTTDFHDPIAGLQKLDESSWAEWGAQPILWNPVGYMEDNRGSAGNMTKTGTIKPAESNDTVTEPFGSYTAGDAIAADIASGKVAWVNGERIVGTEPKLIVFDDFAGADNSDLSGRTPVLGNNWESAQLFTFSTGLNTDDEIFNSALRFGTDAHMAQINAGTPNVMIHALWEPSSDADSRNSIVTRRSSVGNDYLFNFRRDNGDWNFFRYDSDVQTILATGAFTWDAGQIYRATVVWIGDTAYGFIDGVQVFSVTDTTHSSNYHGLCRNTGNNTTVFHQFMVWEVSPTATLADVSHMI